MKRDTAVAAAQQIMAQGVPIGPRMYPCVCGAGRHAHGGKRGTGAAKETGCTRYRPDVAWELVYRALDAQATKLGHSLREADKRDRARHYASNPRAKGTWSIGASDTTTCAKKIEYRNKPPEDFEPDIEDNREARAGTMLHDAITDRMRALYPWRIYKMKVQIAGLDRESELDWYDPITATLDDLKTAGEWKWDQLGPDGPDDDTWGQVFLYGLALEDAGYPVRTIRLIYYRRANGHDEPFERPYERAFAEKYRDKLIGYATNLDLGIPLERMGTGPSTDELCRRCFARSHCWSIPKAEAAGRSPENYTFLGPVPTYDDTVWAIAEKVRARAERLEAEHVEKRADALVDGIEAGRYGDFEVYEKWGGGGVSWKQWAEILVEFYSMPEDQRPALEDLVIPTTRRGTHLVYGKVRKATLDRERRENGVLTRGGAT